jgi:hypothetical protein
MALKAGTQSDWTGSLAELIERRLNDLLLADDLPGLPDGPEEQVRGRRHLFLAIAQAVVEHLHAHPEAFVLADSPRRTLLRIERTP